jgi:hypothetical protein
VVPVIIVDACHSVCCSRPVGYSFKMVPCHRGCHNSDWSYALENQCGAGYVGGARGRCARVARDKFSKLGARSGPRTRSAHSVPSRSDVLILKE